MEHMTGFMVFHFDTVDNAKSALAAAQHQFCKGANHATDLSYVDSDSATVYFKRGIANMSDDVAKAFLKEQEGCID